MLLIKNTYPIIKNLFVVWTDHCAVVIDCEIRLFEYMTKKREQFTRIVYNNLQVGTPVYLIGDKDGQYDDDTAKIGQLFITADTGKLTSNM